MLEMLQNKLELMLNQTVIIVRPFFGTQSDSWTGDLLLFDNTTDRIKFQVADKTATVFTVEDIQSTKLLPEQPNDAPRFIITLKGPKDY